MAEDGVRVPGRGPVRIAFFYKTASEKTAEGGETPVCFFGHKHSFIFENGGGIGNSSDRTVAFPFAEAFVFETRGYFGC